MDLVASSTIVRNYLKPSRVGLANGPQTSQCMRSNELIDKWLKKGKGSLFCFAMGQTTQSLLLWKVVTSWREWCKIWSFLSDTCPNLRCQRNGLEAIRISKTELTKEQKIDSKIEDASETDLQVLEVCSK